MNTKKCSKCGETKDIEDFNFMSIKDNKKRPSCKCCDNLYYQSRKEEFKKRSVENYYMKLEDPNYREILNTQKNEYYHKNKDKISKRRSSPEEREKTNIYYRNKRKTDVNFAIRSNVSSRIRIALKRNKHTKSEYLLGCTIPDYRKYIESLWVEGMSWDNYGSVKGEHTKCWHLDHIKPCIAFDMTKIEDQQLCFHYTNTQPLWAEDNLSKGDKY